MNAISAHLNLVSDPLLPQRDLLLDVNEVTRRLAARLGAGGGPLAIDSCERIRTKYRVGDSLRVLHRIRVGGLSCLVTARAYGEGQSRQAFERAVSAAVTCEMLRPVIHDAELETVFWTFPNDRRIAGLQSLKNIPAELAQLFAPAWTHSQLVAFAPEKCATAQCLDDESRVLAYAKVYAGDDGRRIFDIYNALRQSLSSETEAVKLPVTLAYCESARMLLLEAVEGRRIADLQGVELLRGYRHLGTALAALHNLPVPENLPLFKRLDVERIRRAAHIVAQVRPDAQREACDLADELAERSESSSLPHVCLHGDVHPKNGILRSDGLTLIDFDQAARGNPAADLGSLLASLVYNHRSGFCSQAFARELGEAFLGGYASVRKPPSTVSLRWHTAAALLAERALRAVNRIRPEGLLCLRELLLDAKDILQTGGRR